MFAQATPPDGRFKGGFSSNLDLRCPWIGDGPLFSSRGRSQRGVRAAEPESLASVRVDFLRPNWHYAILQAGMPRGSPSKKSTLALGTARHGREYELHPRRAHDQGVRFDRLAGGIWIDGNDDLPRG